MDFCKVTLTLLVMGLYMFVITTGEDKILSDFPVYEGDTRPGDVWPKPQSMDTTSQVNIIVCYG